MLVLGGSVSATQTGQQRRSSKGSSATSTPKEPSNRLADLSRAPTDSLPASPSANSSREQSSDRAPSAEMVSPRHRSHKSSSKSRHRSRSPQPGTVIATIGMAEMPPGHRCGRSTAITNIIGHHGLSPLKGHTVKVHHQCGGPKLGDQERNHWQYGRYIRDVCRHASGACDISRGLGDAALWLLWAWNLVICALLDALIRPGGLLHTCCLPASNRDGATV
ncbi:hypothetical protein MRX96_047454 [Rhipicephalus microplus]